MTRKSLFAIGLIATTVAGGVAFAHGSGGFGGGAGQGMKMNQPGGPGMMGGMGDMMKGLGGKF